MYVIYFDLAEKSIAHYWVGMQRIFLHKVEIGFGVAYVFLDSTVLQQAQDKCLLGMTMKSKAAKCTP